MAAGKKLDWIAIKTEYITTTVSQRDLAKKYDVAPRTLQQAAVKDGWFAERKAYKSKVVKKSLQKIATKESNLLAKELSIADKISGVLEKALEDAEQFNLHFVTEKNFDDDGNLSSITEEEKVFKKMDMSSLRNAAQALQIVEKMKRSMLNILTEQERVQLELAREKLELERRKCRDTTEGSECGVIELAPVLPEVDDES